MRHRLIISTASTVFVLLAACGGPAEDTDSGDELRVSKITEESEIAAPETPPSDSSLPATESSAVALSAEGTIKDCATCPELIIAPAGSFEMGDLTGQGYKYERPVRSVTLDMPFAIGVYEITFEEWDACVADGGCSGLEPFDQGWGRGKRPVINVSSDDVEEYTDWLSNKTGEAYRLPSEAEWEYAARAGSKTRFSWGDEAGRDMANCVGCNSDSPFDAIRQTTPVGQYPANSLGLYDMHGNVAEWVADCVESSSPAGDRGNYEGAPIDGSARQDCSSNKYRVARGGYFGTSATIDDGRDMSSSMRMFVPDGEKAAFGGFRVARDIE